MRKQWKLLSRSQTFLEDTISLVSGVPFISSFKQYVWPLVLNIVPWAVPKYFLDWELGKWREIYRNQDRSQLLKIPHNNELKELPVITVFDNTEYKFSLSQVYFSRTPDCFQLDPQIIEETKEFLAFHKRFSKLHRRHLDNQTCLRLSRIEIPNSFSRNSFFGSRKVNSLVFNFFREANEEIGIDFDDIYRDQVKFLGITREFIRGGHPDMFMSGQLSLTKNQLLEKYKFAADRYESNSLEFFDFGALAIADLGSAEKKSVFYARVNQFIENYGELISLPLWINLALWCKMRVN
jgi:hypothetical protein